AKDRNDRWRSFAYDGRNQLTDEKWHAGNTNTAAVELIHLTYDTAERERAAKSRDYSILDDHKTDYRLTYDPLSRVKTYEQGVPDAGGFADATLTQGYYKDDLITQTARIGLANDFSNTYVYSNDALDQMSVIFQAQVGT